MSDKPPVSLSPRHMIAIRLIFAGLPIGEAGAAIGISKWRMATVLHSVPGQEYVRHLQSLADNYAAIMVALGITPGDIARAVDGGRYHVKATRRQRKATYMPRVDPAVPESTPTTPHTPDYPPRKPRRGARGARRQGQ